MRVFAIDPGPVQSAYIEWDGERIKDHGLLENQRVLYYLETLGPCMTSDLVIEQIASYGMAVGATVFETCFWSGRFAQAWGRPFHRIPRKDVKLHLCGQPRAKDANIRQALIDRIGPQGTKKQPGPTYGIRGDEWAALAVAVTWWDWHNSSRNVWAGPYVELVSNSSTGCR